MRCIIICNGDIVGPELLGKYMQADTFVICADGGAKSLRSVGRLPDLLLGDFDSIQKDELESLRNKGVEILTYPIEKDCTDSELAIDEAISRGYDEIIILGGVGSRLDHTLANIFLLQKIHQKGVTGIIANDNNEVYITSDYIELKKEEGYKVTLISLTESTEGVTTSGLYYPLVNATLTQGMSIGVSNEFIGDVAKVTLNKGLLLVFKSKD